MDLALCYRNTNGKESNSEDSSDSDAECDVWKRSSRKSPAASPLADKPFTQVASPLTLLTTEPCHNKRKVNNIWSNIVIEDDVAMTMKDVGINQLPENSHDRSCENYDFTRRELDTRPYPEEEHTMDADDDLHKDKKRKISDPSDTRKKIHLNRQDAAVARKICWKLGEQKQFLIYRVVGIVGPQKAVELLKMTEDVEEQGGMLIKSGNRRRSPGGVYFQLLKSDKSISKEQVDEIFVDDTNFFEYIKQSKERKKELKKLKKAKSRPRFRGRLGSRNKKRNDKKMDTTSSATSFTLGNENVTENTEETLADERKNESDDSTSATDRFLEKAEEDLEVDPAPKTNLQGEERMKCENLNAESDIEDGEILD